jgi:hypothetical protein
MNKKKLQKIPSQVLHLDLLPVPKILLREELVDPVKKKGPALIPPIDLLRGKEGHLPKGRDWQRGRVSGLVTEVIPETNSGVISGPVYRHEMSPVKEVLKMLEILRRTVTENGRSVIPNLRIATPSNR